MGASFNNCTFIGAKITWDSESLEVVQTVATALLNLTELFKSQNIHIDTMLKVMPDGKVE